MATVGRRKVESREEAERLYGEMEAAGQDLPSFCLSRGLDGRSLQCWWRNLRLVGSLRSASAPAASRAVRLVEVAFPATVPAPRPHPAATYRIRLNGLAVEVDDDFREDTLARLLDVVRSC